MKIENLLHTVVSIVIKQVEEFRERNFIRENDYQSEWIL